MELPGTVNETCFTPLTDYFKRRLSKTSKNVLEMLKGGKSEEEEDNSIMELYIKAGPNPGEIGDCPFAHYVRSVLHFKNIAHEVIIS